jgi:hypothetical protein
MLCTTDEEMEADHFLKSDVLLIKKNLVKEYRDTRQNISK